MIDLTGEDDDDNERETVIRQRTDKRHSRYGRTIRPVTEWQK